MLVPKHRKTYGLVMTLARPPVVGQREWDAALAEMLEREEAVAAAMHELAAARKRMPMVRVEHEYLFEGPDGRRSLPELFDGRQQLILYRFYFEEGVQGWPDAGCIGCSSVADGIPELGLLHARDITFAMASPAPQANLRRYAERMGWTDVPWYTILTERFSADFGLTSGSASTSSCATATTSTAPTSSGTGRWVLWIGSPWSVRSPSGCIRRRGRVRGLAASAALVAGFAVTMSSTVRRGQPVAATTPPMTRTSQAAATGRRLVLRG